MFEEAIRDTWVFEEIGQEAFEKGLSQGELQGLREGILVTIQSRFPELEAVAKKQLDTIKSSSALKNLISKITTAETEKDVALTLYSLENNSQG